MRRRGLVVALLPGLVPLFLLGWLLVCCGENRERRRQP